jgi:hypothetical protein
MKKRSYLQAFAIRLCTVCIKCFVWLLVKHGARSTRSTEHTEHGAHEVRSSRKTKILYNKIHCLLLQIFVIINKDFSRFTRGEVRKSGF